RTGADRDSLARRDDVPLLHGNGGGWDRYEEPATVSQADDVLFRSCLPLRGYGSVGRDGRGDHRGAVGDADPLRDTALPHLFTSDARPSYQRQGPPGIVVVSGWILGGVLSQPGSGQYAAARMGADLVGWSA